MLFNSFSFIFIFLPITFIGYFVIAAKVSSPLPRLLWLAAASLVFYGQWSAKFLPIIAVSISLNYLAGYVIARFPQGTRQRLYAFAGFVAINLLALGFYKYFNFTINIINGITHLGISQRSIVLPLGISFFTFTQIAYLADIYAGYKVERNIVKYILFVTYFPHLIAGPILHHKEMMWQFGSEENRRLSLDRVAVGVSAFAMGLFKKAVIADSFAMIADPIFNNGGVPPMADAWLAALAYSLQIYFDFSGYSDMALGLSTLFGIKLPFNFNSPYKARNIIDFWRRWHITLSRFLRDYLYIPLGGNRLGKWRRHINLGLTMLLGGLWHGAGWTFVIWGVLHGIFLVCNHSWEGFKQRRPLLNRIWQSPLYMLAALLLTQVCVVVAWVFFRAPSGRSAIRILSGMTGIKSATVPSAFSNPGLMLCAIAFGYLWCLVLPNLNEIFRRKDLGFETYKTPPSWSAVQIAWRPSVLWGIFIGITMALAILAVFKSGRGSPFLYFQF